MPVEETLNYVKYAREIAMRTWDFEKRLGCQICADELEAAIKQFEVSWSLEAMRVMVGAFTKCFLAIARVVPAGGDNPNGGRLPQPLKTKAA